MPHDGRLRHAFFDAPGASGVACWVAMSLPDLPWFAATPRTRRHLVAVSGGADSVALLRLLVHHGFRRLVVCHLDHGLRGRASAADARFVRGLAESLGLRSEIGRERVAVTARRERLSLEVAARQARRRFFAACAAKHGCPRVLLAHHADDQAETILLNLLRGSAGLKGMRMESTQAVAGRRLRLIRPLLETRGAELRCWLTGHRWRWREDASNATPFTARNRLRHEALPLLESVIGRDPVPAILRAERIARAVGEQLDGLLPALHAEDPQGRIHLPVFRALPVPLQMAVLHGWLGRQGVPDISGNLLEQARRMADPAGPAAMGLPGARRLRRTAARLWIERGG